ERGEWVVVLENPLEPGSHEIWLEETSADGAVSESGEAEAIAVPGTAVAEIGEGAEAPAEDDEAVVDTLAVTLPRSGEGEVVILQAPSTGVGISGGGALTLDSLSYDEEGGVTLSGQADAGAEVRPYVDGELA